MNKANSEYFLVKFYLLSIIEIKSAIMNNNVDCGVKI